jgi:hypothetical protein
MAGSHLTKIRKKVRIDVRGFEFSLVSTPIRRCFKAVQTAFQTCFTAAAMARSGGEPDWMTAGGDGEGQVIAGWLRRERVLEPRDQANATNPD